MPDELTESDATADESYPIFPVFVAMDVSLSMKSEIGSVNASFDELKQVVRDDAIVGEICRIGVVSFAGEATTELGLANLQYASVPSLECRGSGTNFAAAFRHLRLEVESSIRSLGRGASFYKPVVFFLTDGEHNATHDAWEEPLDELTSAELSFRPEIVAIGFRNAKEADLRRIGTNHVLLVKDHIDVANQVKEIFKLLIGSVRVNSRTATQAASHGGAMQFDLKPDPNAFVTLPPMRVP